MTLQELIDLKIVRDNAMIGIFEGDSKGLGEIKEEFNLNRIFGRPLIKADLLKAGVKEEYFSYNVKEIWGTKWKFKVAIIIEKTGK